MITLLTLQRLMEMKGYCVLGRIMEGDKEVCKTLERPWQDNMVNISCIPTGIYNVSKYESRHCGKCFRFEDEETKPRTLIRIHAANFPTQVQGCIAVGDDYGLLDGRPAVVNSRKTLTMLLDKYDSFILHIESL